MRTLSVWSFLLFTVHVAITHVRPASSAGVELNPTVMVLGTFDVVPDDQGRSRCMEAVERAAAIGGSRMAFVITLFWQDANEDGIIEGYCIMERNTVCRPVAAANLAVFRSGLTKCFQHAVQLGKSIAIVPHLDDSNIQANAWRNGLVFDPTRVIGGYSYEQVVLDPIADALAASVARNTKVWLALQGEMSATVMRFPATYSSLAPRIRARIAKGNAVLGNIMIGLSFNFNKVDLGGLTLAPAQSGTVFQRYRASKNVVNIDAVQTLLSSMHFIGISSYAPFLPDFEVPELQDAAFLFFKEFTAVGIDLASIMRQKGIELHYSEYGLGGGIKGDGSAPAVTAAQAAHTPFWGVFGPYRKAMDPFQHAEVSDYQRSFYQRTLTWLSTRGGPTHHIDACYVWGMGSWDVLGIYADSTNAGGSYRDDQIVRMIADHNTKN